MILCRVFFRGTELLIIELWQLLGDMRIYCAGRKKTSGSQVKIPSQQAILQGFARNCEAAEQLQTVSFEGVKNSDK